MRKDFKKVVTEFELRTNNSVCMEYLEGLVHYVACYKLLNSVKMKLSGILNFRLYWLQINVPYLKYKKKCIVLVKWK